MTAAVLVAFVGGVTGTWLARKLAWQIGFISYPNPIVPQHVRGVAYLGGAGIAVGIVASTALVTWPAGRLLGVLCFLVLGTVDDARPIPPLRKLIAQTTLALAFALADGRAAGWQLAGEVAWIVVIVNAVNLTDVCDGLVAALAVVALALVGCVGDPRVAWPIAGATAGLWLFNRAPASIFLGDGGSHLLGFAIAAAWLDAWHATRSWNVALAAMLGAAVFLLELGFLIVVRRRRGIPFWRGSPDHLALRLQAAGLSKHETVVVAVAAALTTGILAVRIARMPGAVVTLLAIAVVVMLVRAVAALYAHEPVPRAGRMRTEGES